MVLQLIGRQVYVSDSMAALAGTNDAYKEVKRATDSHLGVPSQCLHPTKASIGMPPRRSRQQYYGNVVSSHSHRLLVSSTYSMRERVAASTLCMCEELHMVRQGFFVEEASDPVGIGKSEL